MSEQWIRTSACGEHRHPEFSMRIAEPLPIPGLEGILVTYFETAVAEGTVFRAEQIVDFAGSALRLFDRPDGSLGVLELVGNDWSDSVQAALLQSWYRQEVVRSFGLELSFPALNATALACTQLAASTRALLLKRQSATNRDDSGWFLGCTDESHDHGTVQNLVCLRICDLTHRFPWLGQFLALPVGTELVVEAQDGRISVPILWRGEDPVEPRSGSYVEALNSGVR